MHSELYTSTVPCPICEKNFSVVKAKTAAYKLDHTDEDFCMHYRDLNPLVYDVWICEHCGYAEFGASFDKISVLDKAKVRRICLKKFTDDPYRSPFELSDYHNRAYHFFDKLSPEGERDNYAGIESFEILLLLMEARKAPDSEKAKALLRIGWLYRFMNEPTEAKYLLMAADLFANAFEVENLESGQFDSATCAYMAGELYRRVNDGPKASEWLRRALTAAQKADNKVILAKARDQMQLVKNVR